jgi:hypothetical protein
MMMNGRIIECVLDDGLKGMHIFSFNGRWLRVQSH